MARIAIDARFYRKSTAGVGRYTRGLVHHLQPLDSANDYTIILTPDDYKEWPKESQPSNWTVKVLDIVHYSLGEQTQLLSYLNQEKFDLVHFTMFNHPLLYRGKFVVTIHDLTMTLFPLRPLWHPRTWAYRYTMQHAATKAQKVIAPSLSTKNDIITHLHTPENKIVLTYEAVEPEFQPQNDAKTFALVREKFGITKPFILFVNAWRPHKGLPELIEAFLKAKVDADIQLVVAGKPNASFPSVIEAVEAAKKKTPDIITPGFIDDEDMINLYNMTAGFVFSSHYEGFGLGLAEALACGSPTISADNSSLPEVGGEASLYYPTGNTDALAQAIVRLTKDPALQQSLRQKGLERSKQFSFDKMAQETLTAYQSVLQPV